MKSLCVGSLCLLALTGGLWAAEAKPKTPASPELERIKNLAGTWKGKADMGKGTTDFTVEYRLIAGGSAVEERIFAGSPKEMVTLYYDQAGKLGLTHYCMLGNRPAMVLKSADAKSMKFDFDPNCGVDAKSEMHMHSLTISFEGEDTIIQAWNLFENGKLKEGHQPFTLKRVKA